MSSRVFYYNSLDQSISSNRVSAKFLSLLCFIEIPVFYANSVDSDQMPHSATFDLDQHCSAIALFEIPN